MKPHLGRFSPRLHVSKWLVCLVVSLGGLPRAEAQAVRESLWVTNGTVNAIAASGGTVYIGGDFTYVGPGTGGAVAIDAATGSVLQPYPQVLTSDVRAAASDGNGGWYIAGDFTSVRGQPRHGLAHIDAAGDLTSWDPNMNVGPNTAINALVVDGGTVYVGGGFTGIGGQPRNNLAAIDANTGVATAWNPSPNSYIQTLAVSGSTVYVGGDFTTIGGQARTNIAAINAGTGGATGWNPNPNNSNVLALAVSGNTVYVGGIFTSIGGQSRSRIAAIDASTGLATSWNPSMGAFDPIVFAVEVSGSRVYVGGRFTSVGGQPRSNLAAINIVTGAPTSWNPSPNNLVLDMAVSGSTIYVGGSFSSIGGVTRSNLAAFSTATGIATSWNPKADGRGVHGLAVNGSAVFAVGTFHSVGGVDRNWIAALDASTGIPTSWNPNANNGIKSLVVNGGKVYAGGTFTSIGGQPRSGIAALDAATGAATGWNPNATGFVNALAVRASTVYAGGDFSSIGGQMRNSIAALDVVTGAATSWNPNALGGTVSALAASGSTVYVGGSFLEIGGQSRNHLAAINATSGAATSWNPNPDYAVYAIAPRKGRILVGGDFVTIAGQARNRVAAINSASGAATAWNPNADGTVKALAVSGGKVYVGGTFSNIHGLPRLGLAVIINSTGTVRSWDAKLEYPAVQALAVNAGTIHVGGDFGSAHDRPHSYFAGFSEAALAITEDNLGRGFVITDFVVGFPPPTPYAMGVAFLPNQSVLVSHFSGRLFGLPNHDDNQEPGSPIRSYAGSPGGLAQIQIGGIWHYYMALGDEVVEVNPVSGATQTVVQIPGARWLTPFPPGAASPLQGHLFVTGFAGIWDVDPVAGSQVLFASTGYVEGITFSPNGDLLYAAIPSLDVVRAFAVPGAIPVWDSPSHQDSYTGVSVGLGNLGGYIYVTTVMGNIWEFGLPGGSYAGVDNLLATGGTGLFAAASDPVATCPGGFPSLLVTAVDHIARVDPPGGGWFGGPTSSAAPFGGTTGVSDRPLATLWLARPQPNPAMGRASLSYSLPRESNVELSIFDIDGRRVRTLARGRMTAGQHHAAWDGRDDGGRPVVSGVFYIMLSTGREKTTRSLVLLR